MNSANFNVLFGTAAITLTACVLVTRAILRLLLRCHVLCRRLLIVGAGRRTWELLLLRGRERSSLHDDVTLLPHQTLGPADPRLIEERASGLLRPETFDVAKRPRRS